MALTLNYLFLRYSMTTQNPLPVEPHFSDSSGLSFSFLQITRYVNLIFQGDSSAPCQMMADNEIDATIQRAPATKQFYEHQKGFRGKYKYETLGTCLDLGSNTTETSWSPLSYSLFGIPENSKHDLEISSTIPVIKHEMSNSTNNKENTGIEGKAEAATFSFPCLAAHHTLTQTSSDQHSPPDQATATTLRECIPESNTIFPIWLLFQLGGSHVRNGELFATSIKYHLAPSDEADYGICWCLIKHCLSGPQRCCLRWRNPGTLVWSPFSCFDNPPASHPFKHTHSPILLARQGQSILSHCVRRLHELVLDHEYRLQGEDSGYRCHSSGTNRSVWSSEPLGINLGNYGFSTTQGIGQTFDGLQEGTPLGNIAIDNEFEQLCYLANKFNYDLVSRQADLRMDTLRNIDPWTIPASSTPFLPPIPYHSINAPNEPTLFGQYSSFVLGGIAPVPAISQGVYFQDFGMTNHDFVRYENDSGVTFAPQFTPSVVQSGYQSNDTTHQVVNSTNMPQSAPLISDVNQRDHTQPYDTTIHQSQDLPHRQEQTSLGSTKANHPSKNKTYAKNIKRTKHKALVFACDQCDATFSRPYELRDHQRRHAGEKPYSCPDCHDVFSTRSNMTRHRKTPKCASSLNKLLLQTVGDNSMADG